MQNQNTANNYPAENANIYSNQTVLPSGYNVQLNNPAYNVPAGKSAWGLMLFLLALVPCILGILLPITVGILCAGSSGESDCSWGTLFMYLLMAYGAPLYYLPIIIISIIFLVGGKAKAGAAFAIFVSLIGMWPTYYYISVMISMH